MKALILAGGFATRLQPLTKTIPKALLPIGNIPFLAHQIGLLVRHGVTDVTLLTGYLAEDFDRFSSSAARLGATLQISTEAEPLGTAGAIRSVTDGIDDTFLVLNGDVLTDIDIGALIAFHRERDAAITMSLTFVPDSDGFGVVPIDERGAVQEFIQNVKGESKPGDWINAGIYVMEPSVMARVPAGVKVEFEHPPDPVFPALLADNVPFYAMRCEGYWIDIGNRERYLQANADLLDRAIEAPYDGQLLRVDQTLSDGTHLGAPILLSHAPVGKGARLGPHAVLGGGVRIGEGATVERSVLLPGAQVAPRATVRDSILGPSAVIDADDTVIEQIVV